MKYFFLFIQTFVAVVISETAEMVYNLSDFESLVVYALTLIIILVGDMSLSFSDLETKLK